EDSALALPERVEDIGFHSKASDDRDSEDVLLPPLFLNRRGFSSFFSPDGLQKRQITLGSGLDDGGNRLDQIHSAGSTARLRPAGAVLHRNRGISGICSRQSCPRRQRWFVELVRIRA